MILRTSGPSVSKTMKWRMRSSRRRLSKMPRTSVASSGVPFSAMAVPSTVRHGMNRSVGAVHAVARLQPVRRDQQLVIREQTGDLLLVGLELVEGLLDRRLLVGRVLELDDSERQPVDEDDHIGPLVDLALDHGELVDGEPVVGVDVVEVDEPGLVAGNRAVGPRVLHVDANDWLAINQ